MAEIALTAEDLIAFEREVAERFERGEIHSPVHLNSDTQAEPLIEIFREVKPTDWVLGTWRAHFHALLKGVPREQVMAEILAGRSMMLHFPEHRFMTSAIMGGMLPIACGLAAGGERVWCFIGDMCSFGGACHEAALLSENGNLPLSIITEDNDLSTNTPTTRVWGSQHGGILIPRWQRRRYGYKRTTPHYQPLRSQAGF